MHAPRDLGALIGGSLAVPFGRAFGRPRMGLGLTICDHLVQNRTSKRNAERAPFPRVTAMSTMWSSHNKHGAHTADVESIHG